MKDYIKVGIAQIRPELGDLDKNVERHVQFIAEGRSRGLDVLVFPELSLTGYSLEQPHRVARLATHEMFAELARHAGDMATVVGAVELGFAAQIHNSAFVLREGRTIYIHRKLNMANYGKLNEGKFFGVGRYLETFELLDNWCAATMICADVWNPALMHLATLNGATLALVPANSATGTVGDKFSNFIGWGLLTRFYAMIYGMPILMANRIGREFDIEFWGQSTITGPSGDLIAKAAEDEEELIDATLSYRDVIEARAMLPTVRDSNLDLIHREINRLRGKIGYPLVVKEHG